MTLWIYLGLSHLLQFNIGIYIYTIRNAQLSNMPFKRRMEIKCLFRPQILWNRISGKKVSTYCYRVSTQFPTQNSRRFPGFPGSISTKFHEVFYIQSLFLQIIFLSLSGNNSNRKPFKTFS